MACILLIDDEASVRSTLGKYLSHAGHEVVEASDGKQAMELLEESPVDLVIADLYMPEMDGIEFTSRLGQQVPGVKIIAISGGGYLDKHKVLEMARNLGMARTLAKPFTRDDLLAAVREVLTEG